MDRWDDDIEAVDENEVEAPEPTLFNLISEDRDAIDLAVRLARRFLRDSRTTPLEVIGLGNALYALERLPAKTVGANSSFGVHYRNGDASFSERRYFTFNIFEELFEISIGGSVYDSSIGSDSFSDPGWMIELGGYAHRECDLEQLERSIEEYLSFGAEIDVNDCSQIEYQ